MSNKFSIRLKELRTKSKKTQEDIANLLHIKRSTYGEYERGKITPPVDKIEQLADIFGVKPHYLIGWDTANIENNKEESKLAITLKQMREDKHKTLEEMSDEIGIPIKVLSQYENGIRKIPYSALKKLANYFELDILYLHGMELNTGLESREELAESVYRLRMAEIWNREIGKSMFSDEELYELINFGKYILYKRTNT